MMMTKCTAMQLSGQINLWLALDTVEANSTSKKWHLLKTNLQVKIS